MNEFDTMTDHLTSDDFAELELHLACADAIDEDWMEQLSVALDDHHDREDQRAMKTASSAKGRRLMMMTA